MHGYVEEHAKNAKKLFLFLLHIPGLYKKVPAIFSKQAPRLFGEAAGFAANEIKTSLGVWRIDMIKCRITTFAQNTAVRSSAAASFRTEKSSHLPRIIFSA